jgi:hypothetical protein
MFEIWSDSIQVELRYFCLYMSGGGAIREMADVSRCEKRCETNPSLFQELLPSELDIWMITTMMSSRKGGVQ